MDKIYIICIDDQQEVLNAVIDDIDMLSEKFYLEECDSAGEAQELMEQVQQAGDYVGIVISDHVMPELTGVDFLSGLNASGEYPHLKKVLLTGLATHEDTMTAINNAHIDYYIPKPWKKEHLIQVVKKLLTAFILETGLDYNQYMEFLDQETLFNNLKGRV